MYAQAIVNDSGKHVMLSYQWDHKRVVEKVYEGLNKLGIKTWMDTKGGMKDNIIDSMASGVENAAVICCFMSPKYQESKNCKKELSYADNNDIPIVPVMLPQNWKATSWLGLVTAGLLWIDFRNSDNIETRIESLAKEIVHRAGPNLNTLQPKTARLSNVDLEKKPGRAFRHLQSGKYLAEYEEKTAIHIEGGKRIALVLCDEPESSSYWIEETKDKESGIKFYKNYYSKSYLGYDPAGDYVYTKDQPFGAEEWLLVADESSSSGERRVVIFANYGQKYLSVRNGFLTGAFNRDPDSVWILV